MAHVAPEVAQRIRRPMPRNQCVLPGSLPVVSFGDVSSASVATLSLNPSWREFESPDGNWLHGSARRLASLTAFGVSDARKLTDEQVAQVVAESNAYFRGSWFETWFGWTQDLLKRSGCGSYLDGTACHLDLVQWATKPVQDELSPLIWETLVNSDRDFLRWQLENCSLRVLLLNGRTVVDELKNAGIVEYDDEDDLPFQTRSGSPDKLKVSRGRANGILILGWNRTLHQALSTDARGRLSEWVRRMVHEHGKAPVKRQSVPPVVRRRAPRS